MGFLENILKKQETKATKQVLDRLTLSNPELSPRLGEAVCGEYPEWTHQAIAITLPQTLTVFQFHVCKGFWLIGSGSNATRIGPAQESGNPSQAMDHYANMIAAKARQLQSLEKH
jgi:hypothetical protein